MSVEIADIARFLQGTAPFDVLDNVALRTLLSDIDERYFRREEVIIEPGDEGKYLHIIRSGAVELFDPLGNLLDTRDIGECFGYSTINGTGTSRYRIVAAADTLALRVPATVFRDVVASDPRVREFFDTQTSSIRWQAVNARIAASGGDGGAFPVAELVARAAVTITPEASIHDAAKRMTDERVSSLLIVSLNGELRGILTDRDLRSRVLARGVSPATAVAEVMTADPITVDATASVFEAAIEMMDRGINHLPVVMADTEPRVVAARDGEHGVESTATPQAGTDAAEQRGAADEVAGGSRPRPLGLVTSTDIVRLSNADPIFLAGRIARAPNVDEVGRVMARLPEVTVTLLRRGVLAEGIGQVLSACVDAATRRLIDLAIAELGPPPMQLCWVAVGSQARRELSSASDQDNALVLERQPQGQEEEDYVAELARRVNRSLAQVGVPRCPGLIEASNPMWRRTPDGWGEAATNWAAAPEAESVLEAQIFFDMRPVFGDPSLCDAAREQMLGAAVRSTRFHAHLAAAAAKWRPPLGFFRGLVVEKRGKHRNTLDVKAGGIAALVQVARLAAIAEGLPEVGTMDRYRAAAAAGALTAQDADNLLSAFATLRHLQVENHARRIEAGQDPDNHIEPDTLSAWDRRDLRRSFRVIADYLDALALRYPLMQM